jgi:hypothetical protein
MHHHPGILAHSELRQASTEGAAVLGRTSSFRQLQRSPSSAGLDGPPEEATSCDGAVPPEGTPSNSGEHTHMHGGGSASGSGGGGSTTQQPQSFDAKSQLIAATVKQWGTAGPSSSGRTLSSSQAEHSTELRRGSLQQLSAASLEADAQMQASKQQGCTLNSGTN